MGIRQSVLALLLVAALTGPVAAAAAPVAVGPDPAAPSEAETTRILPLTQALSLAESHSPGLRLAAFQLASARAGLTAAPANAQNLAPAASALLQAQYGITIPAEAITATTTGNQAAISYEQAAAQYYKTRQQVRSGVMQAYVEWQRAWANIRAQETALDRALTQEAYVAAALEAGTAAQYDLLQVQAAVAGQRAALIGARAAEAGARSALESVVGRALAAVLLPEPALATADQVTLPTDGSGLLRRALTARPDLRDLALTLNARRLQQGLATGGNAALQVQAAALQYEYGVARARMEIEQALLSAQGAQAELKAREAALAPALEALRLAELRFEAGIATFVEVQGAAATAAQAESARIQAATNLALRLLQLRQAVGDL